MASTKNAESDGQDSNNLEKYSKSALNSQFSTEGDELIDPYEKKYYALLRRCNSIQQNNEKLVNRIHHVKKLLRQVRKEKKALMKRLDHYNDEYRKVPIEMLLEESPSPVPPVSATSTQSSPRPSSVVKKKIKQEKDKDPNAPKRPANPFFLFCQEQRTTILERFQQEPREDIISHPELTKTLAKNWNNLSPDDKKVYYDLYEKEKERYEQEMKVYNGKENSLGADTG